MFTHILLPTDGSKLSLNAVRLGVDIAQRCGARVLAIHALPPMRTIGYAADLFASMKFDYVKETARYAERYLADAHAIAAEKEVPFEQMVLFESQPYEAILQTAIERRCDLIVMASHRWEPMGRIVIGSETRKVLLKADIPVFVTH